MRFEALKLVIYKLKTEKNVIFKKISPKMFFFSLKVDKVIANPKIFGLPLKVNNRSFTIQNKSHTK